MTSALSGPSLHHRMRAAHEGGRLCRTVLQGEDMQGSPALSQIGVRPFIGGAESDLRAGSGISA